MDTSAGVPAKRAQNTWFCAVESGRRVRHVVRFRAPELAFVLTEVQRSAACVCLRMSLPLIEIPPRETAVIEDGTVCEEVAGG